ncbi:MAG: hypothetical protein IKL19_04845 [Paludibacteraceae bacterium]|nr:hypothetical protein [Paludibacteraceae bacterium]
MIIFCSLGHHVQRYEKIDSILFSLVQTFQYLLPYPARFIGVQPKRKCNDHFKVIECCPTFRRSQITSLGNCRAKRSISLPCVSLLNCHRYYF